MQISLFAIGRMKSGPERELVARYLTRFEKSAPAIGLGFSGLTEKPESRLGDAAQRKREEASWLTSHLEDQISTALILLDETGKSFASEALAETIAKRRDTGTRDLVFAIGGADGHDESLRARADLVLSFGAATWPHQMVRIMLAEQLYRCVTILSGHPYHRS
ncbi:MAG: 23S rRNA (pseudouridine(1915)-N(3))-methyltransferase RlmH [Notoacmeibacter sp.]